MWSSLVTALCRIGEAGAASRIIKKIESKLLSVI